VSDLSTQEPVGHSGVFAPGRRMLTTGLVLIITLVAFESMSVATVMPLVEDDLGQLALYGWVFSAFFLGTLIGVVVAGTAADRMRPVVPFVIGLIVFSIGLFIGGVAPSMLVLVLGRFLQGLGAGVMPATAYVCIGRSYPSELRPTMFAMISSAWMIPSLIGPLLAAWIGQTVGWRWVFLGLLPLCAAIGSLAVFGVRLVPAPLHRSTERNIVSALRVAAGAGMVIAGLGSHNLLIGIPLVVVGTAALIPAFRRLTPPGTLTARAGLPVTVSVRGLLNFGFYAADVFVPFVVISIRGESPVMGGLALTTCSLLWTVASWLQTRLIVRVGARLLTVIGMAIIGVGSLGMILVLVPALPVWFALIAWGIAGFGMGLAYSPLAHVAMEIAGQGQEGKITTALQLSDTLGVALGTGVAGVLVASIGSLTGSEITALVVTFVVAGAVAILGSVLSVRIPGQRELT